MMCYNVGKCEVDLNGLGVQLSFCRDDTDMDWTRGEVQLKDGDRVEEIGFFYADLTPAEARKMAAVLLKAAERSDIEYAKEPTYIIMENGKPMYDIDSGDYVIHNTEEDAKRECLSFQRSTNEGLKYSYRALTPKEFWGWMNNGIIE